MNQQTKETPWKVKRARLLFFLALSFCLTNIQAQTKMVKVMKNGSVVFETSVSDIDSVIFYHPKSGEDVLSSDYLIVSKNNGSLAGQSSLDDISNLTFSNNDLVLKPKKGASETYLFSSISKVSFNEGGVSGTEEIYNQSGINAYLSSQGEIRVESDSQVLSLTLFSGEGKIWGESSSNTMFISHLPIGIYILRIETTQGFLVKKIINHSNIR
ncbi:MAG TPA: T9SS type A sorting domain-containing protein [Paludibacteraceae bacterium]|jgi:hypothetical protein|nr:T9SS type A sorting domain-containing protein [Paludibacteraceae bacterium]HOU67572.1 T9SS type A sorting domain-containing protein [Paludibacteraceae bacterium]HPH62158.1 T9SS type A sorting domain-containing protein [Paludibacteraceae bacterium]HQF49638.1 T9SS type A sorting domain-containing protein [Paludibacteraceae bacterium]